MLYIPNIIVAILILSLGYILQDWFHRSWLLLLKTWKKKQLHHWYDCKLCYYHFNVFIILGQLNIAGSIVNYAFILFFGAICLALGWHLDLEAKSGLHR